jgi:phosphatidylinositol glycan class O
MQSKAPLPNAAAPKGKAPRDVKAEDKRLAVQFKAQHGLIVAFFVLILYAGYRFLKSACCPAIFH